MASIGSSGRANRSRLGMKMWDTSRAEDAPKPVEMRGGSPV
jgi:hypothetical protein